MQCCAAGAGGWSHLLKSGFGVRVHDAAHEITATFCLLAFHGAQLAEETRLCPEQFPAQALATSESHFRSKANGGLQRG